MRLPTVASPVLKPLVAGLMRRSLRTTFRRVCWVGPPPELPDARPVVLYANHHNFYDGYLLWLLITQWLKRPGLTWMEDRDRFPFFGATGAQPFPRDDAKRRAATLRHTVRQFRRQPTTILAYFPEGRLHPPEDGLLPFVPDAIERLDKLLPNPLWWPVAIHVTWWGETHPTALLTGGTPQATTQGDEHDRLASCWQTLRRRQPDRTLTLLEGSRSLHERWNLSFLNCLLPT